jgi:hypothetical protein
MRLRSPDATLKRVSALPALNHQTVVLVRLDPKALNPAHELTREPATERQRYRTTSPRSRNRARPFFYTGFRTAPPKELKGDSGVGCDEVSMPRDSTPCCHYDSRIEVLRVRTAEDIACDMVRPFNPGHPRTGEVGSGGSRPTNSLNDSYN